MKRAVCLKTKLFRLYIYLFYTFLSSGTVLMYLYVLLLLSQRVSYSYVLFVLLALCSALSLLPIYLLLVKNVVGFDKILDFF